jgi:serine/threonine-protein kinase
MEYVDGLPITRYCDEHGLSISGRLDLFCAVCDAVDHAHRNLVLHRDLKPSNILVTSDGQPKLLDFGIARVLSATKEDEEALTQAAGRMLTPEYAAPEQFRGEAMTTATDVFSLGAVLFELLTGCRPFPARRDRDTLSDRELECEPPSIVTAVTVSESVEEVARVRATDRTRLRRQLAGDLETIVATALRSSVERRYASVEALRQDITRHRQQLPVLARPDTAAYRISRFVRRHRWGVSSASAIALLVLAFAATTLVQAGRIQAQATQLEAERDRARSEADAATRRLIARRGYRASNVQPSAERSHAADTLLSTALAMARDIDAGSVATADAMVKLAAIARGGGEQDRADSLLLGAIAIYRERLGDDHRSVANTRSMLGSALLRRDRPLEAIPLFELALASYQRNAEPPAGLLLTRYHLAVALRDVGRLTESAALFQTTLGDFETRFPPSYILTAHLRHEFSRTLLELGRAVEAEAMLQSAIPVLMRRWGESDLRVDHARVTLARVLTALGRFAEAEEMLGSALQRLEHARGPDDPATRRARHAFAMLQLARPRS